MGTVGTKNDRDSRSLRENEGSSSLLWEPAVREVAATIEEYLIRHSRNANAVFKEKTAETPVTGSRASRIA